MPRTAGWTRPPDWKGGFRNDVQHASHPLGDRDPSVGGARASTLPYFTAKFRPRRRNVAAKTDNDR